MSDILTRTTNANTAWEYDPMLGRPSPVYRPPNAADSETVAGRQPLAPELLARMQRYWEAANYLTVGQIYLEENPLLREPLRPEQIKPRLLGHWGTSPGLSLLYIHLNRLIKETGADVIYIAGPGHGGPALNATAYLENAYTEVHPDITQDFAGMRRLFREFSTPGGVPSHCGPHTPNSMHEGGELGYSLVHAYGAAFDNPDLIVACVVGDGEAETGPLEGSWKGNKFLNPVRDGAVLPILHLNGYKIAGPTVLARIDPPELMEYFRGHGYAPYLVEGDDPTCVHQWLAATLDQCYQEIRAIQQDARTRGFQGRPLWPMIILRTPKGWTGPQTVDGVPVEGTFRAHQVPLTGAREDPAHLRLLEAWLKSYHPEQQFDASGRLVRELAALAPEGDRRMGANPHVNGGRLTRELDLPAWTEYGLNPPGPGQVSEEGTRRLGAFLRDIIRRNPETFRLFCPDETNSNRLNAVFEVTDRATVETILPIDDHLAPDGRVLEVLSEHCCQGWLEGYVLTGRHGMWATYEAFAQIVDSMLTQHVKWIKQCLEQPWRKPIPSLNVLLTSHVWRQDHNGFTHQSPGYVDGAVAKRSTIVRAYFPPDANCLLSVADHCFRSRNYVNLITAGKQPQLQWLNVEEAHEHCARGASVWKFASSDAGSEPDVILACAGDIPTLETCAAAWLLRKHVPELKVRVINVVDLFVLTSPEDHPHGMSDDAFEALFTREVPVIFAYHGYPWVIHGAIHHRPNTERFHVHGFREEGTTTTPFDMVVLNQLSRFHLAIDALRYVPRLRSESADVVDRFNRKLEEHRAYVREHFEDLPEIADWHWTSDLEKPTAPPRGAGGPYRQGFTDA